MSGTNQTIPTRTIVGTIDSAAPIVGDGWPERLARQRDRRDALRWHLAGLLDEGAARTLREAANYSDVVFEAEQIDPKVMESRPRGRNEPMFGPSALTIAALQGLSVFAATLAVYLWTVFGGRPDDVVRSATFAALVVGNLALILVNRSWRLPVWLTFRERRNKTLKWILGGAVVLLVVILSVPGPAAGVRLRRDHAGRVERCHCRGLRGCRLVRDLQSR